MSSADTSLPRAGDPKTLYVVDISGYVFRAYHALPPLSSPSGEPTNAVLGVTTMLQRLVQEHQPALLAVAMDSRGASFRKERYAEYKANRPPAPQELVLQLSRVQQVIDAFHIPKFQVQGAEADDVIATLVRWARAEGLNVVVVSSDKDLMQLVGGGVWMLDSMRNAVLGPSEVEAKLGVKPSQVRDYLSLVGDSSDNVPGVPSVGPKTAAQLLSTHGSLDKLYEELAAVSKPALREKLATHKDQAYLSRDLVSLHENLELGVEREKLTRVAPDAAALRQLFTELGFTRLMQTLPAAAPGAAAAAVTSSDSGEPAVTNGTGASAQPAAREKPDATLVLDAQALRALVASLSKAEQIELTCLAEGEHPVSAHLIGFAFAWPDGCAYIPLGHTNLGHPEQLATPAVLEALAPVLHDAARPKVCADAKREMLLLAAHGLTLSGVRFDCALASYLIDPERHGHTLADIARFDLDQPLSDAAKALLVRVATPGAVSGDEPSHIASCARELLAVVATAQAALGTRLTATKGDSLLTDIELPLAGVLARMELTGIRLDSEQLHRLSSQVAEQLVELEARCKRIAGRDFNVGSPRQLETILFDELKLPVVKRTKTARSTDHEVLEELAAQHELPAVILEHRMLAKLKSTYLDALPKQVNRKTGRIHTDFRQTVAATGRLSSSDPNLQNIPIRSEVGRSIRLAFVPRDGWSILAADYSQIELRVLAHLSHDPELVDAFRKDADVHTRTARALFGVSEADVTREMRAQAKTVNYAVIYGQTQFALARNLRIERSRAAHYIHAFFEQYAGVKAYLDGVVEQARTSCEIRTLCGRVRKLPDLQSNDRVRRQAAERVARNTPIQGSAADILKLAMLGIARELEHASLQARMLLTVHDELVCEAPPDEHDAVERIVCTQMEGTMALEVPLVVDKGWGKSWGDAH